MVAPTAPALVTAPVAAVTVAMAGNGAIVLYAGIDAQPVKDQGFGSSEEEEEDGAAGEAEG